MLILTRKPGESICIGADIKITICAINGHQVRVGVDAPQSIEVDREEVRNRKQAEYKAYQEKIENGK